MSVFSKLKFAKKAAKEHKEKAAAAGKEPVVKTKYVHVPTHAAVDALSGAPSSWKNEDRPRIKAEHRRRTAMTISRTGSSLSQVLASGSDSPLPSSRPLPRVSSYSSYNPTWWDRGDTEHIRNAYMNSTGQKLSRGNSYLDSGLGSSPAVTPIVSAGTSENISPVDSISNSAASVSSSLPEIQNRSQHQYADNDIFDRLHKNTGRKLGEAPILDSPPVVVKAPVVNVAAAPVGKKKRWTFKGKGRDSRDSGVAITA